ncbi:MAG: glycosyltransferase family 4 protein [Abditibacteriales bacterium]|nr:glycosyltransferase family 4 protein [Abditibacteriales bacterium]MDW8367423.1 glycosyltransferase family 1 protein [Abditibacteriales bacterium]
MRIGIDGSLLYGKYSGVEYAIWNLLKSLAKAESGDEFIVYVPHDFRSDCEFPANWRFVRTRFDGGQKLLRVLWQQLVLPRLMLKDQLDIFHAPAYVMPLRAPVPTVLTVYDAIAFTHPQFCTLANRLHYRRVMPPSLQKARRVIVPSQVIRSDLINVLRVLAEKIEVVPLGVEDIFFAEPSRERQRAVKEEYQLPDRFFLFVGNIEAKKNLSVLVKSLAGMHSPLPLVVAGNPFRASDLGTRLPLSQMLGYVPRADLPALYALATGLVFPSHYEGFGLPPLEAMACGTPVIVSTAGALPEVVGKAAMLAKPDAPAEWAMAMELIVKDAELRERLVRLGRERARRFTWENTAQATLKVYRSVVAEVARLRGDVSPKR